MYKIKRINNYEEWDNYVDKSPNGNIFFKSFFLEPIGKNISKNFILKGDKVKAAFILILDKENNIIDNEVMIHSGLIVNRYNEKDSSVYNLEIYSITEFFVKHLIKNFKNIQFNTVPDFLDVRPFLWHNYNLNKNFFTCYPKYTSFIDIKYCDNEINNPKNIFHKMNTLRRRLIRKGLENDTKFNSSKDINFLVRSYENYMIKQKSPVSLKKLNEMKKLLKNLSLKDKLEVKIGLTKSNKEGYLCIFAHDLNFGYYLYGCPLLDNIENYLGSITFWETFKDLSKKGIVMIDMEGINSPARGWFKQSFGGLTKQYYEIKLNN